MDLSYIPHVGDVKFHSSNWETIKLWDETFRSDAELVRARVIIGPRFIGLTVFRGRIVDMTVTYHEQGASCQIVLSPNWQARMG